MSGEREHLCTACGGRGYSGWCDNLDRVWVEQRDCERCNGTGNEQAPDLERFDRDGVEQSCEHCDGSGQEPCPPKGDVERALRRAEEGVK